MFVFEVLTDATFLGLPGANPLDPAKNKFVMSIVNDFEDGKWRDAKFEDFIWDNVAESALSAGERQLLKDRPSSLLRAAAKNLRMTDKPDDKGSGSELAEILLYGIMRHKLRALPVVPKIFYKQNTKDYAKGADSVHIVVHTPPVFSLWFGEAKFYKSIEDARLPAIIASVEESLSTKKLKKENAIITNISDLDQIDVDDGIRTSVKAMLAQDVSIDTIKPILNIPILLLHECTLTKNAGALTEQYRKDLVAYHTNRANAYFAKQIASLSKIHDYASIKFHLILFPVPEKKRIVESFLAKAKAQST